MRTEFEPWREAFNLALGGFATRMLIDIGRLGAFREAINAVPTARRIQFEGVRTGLRDEVGLDDRTLPGRLDYRPSPFTAWLRSDLARRFDYVCVETPKLLAQYPKALTITGQTSERGRGAHGGHGRGNLLGFTNSRLLADLEHRIGRARERLDDALRQVAAAEQNLNSFEERRAAHQTLTELSWDQVDVASVSAERDRWTKVIDEVRAGNPEIDKLQQQVDDLKKRVTGLTERHRPTEGHRADARRGLGRRSSTTSTCPASTRHGRGGGHRDQPGPPRVPGRPVRRRRGRRTAPGAALTEFDAAINAPPSSSAPTGRPRQTR